MATWKTNKIKVRKEVLHGKTLELEEAEQPLKMMVETVQNGGDLSRYLAFDKQGVLLHFS